MTMPVAHRAGSLDDGAVIPAWRADRLRDDDEIVRWRPVLRVSQAATWAGRDVDDRWVVGKPGAHVLRAESAQGVIALLPLLDRPVTEVAAELGTGVSSLPCHDLGLERVLGAALHRDSSGHWTTRAIAWIDAGFPFAGCRDALIQAASDRRVPQRARQTAARILTRNPRSST
ncbi:hypothetical protein [Amycolatopsis suaedae]|uniref:Uncharacterized protein n=1 Tax=Amycolatopsis suaedae TaxID=2510978 RepID=A0A4Q7J398_9PSEU|nr:hypothetical protein [Amycolatopsis suaedae]RZQ61439.1 hypothetical protein EWH70_23975 [Amycolatopsis suaedae]